MQIYLEDAAMPAGNVRIVLFKIECGMPFLAEKKGTNA